MAFDIKGKMETVLLALITLIIIFNLIGNTADDVSDSMTDVCDSGFKLANLFNPNGIMGIVYMAGLLIAAISLALSIGKGVR